MSAIFEGRVSDSPYIHMIWRGRVEHDYSPTCPADERWNVLLAKYQGRVKVTVEGPTTQAIFKNQFEGSEFLVIKFKLGAFIPDLPVTDLLNRDALLPEAGGKSFWLKGSPWRFPDFENVETFVDRLVRHEVLVVDPVVKAALQDQPQEVSSRTVRRRFLRATGLTPGSIRQIERAQQATALLEKGVPILDAVYQTGYADQPHLTRALKRYTGQTPAQIVRMSQPG
jgi:AraC-like DNA-binding protein